MRRSRRELFDERPEEAPDTLDPAPADAEDAALDAGDSPADEPGEPADAVASDEPGETEDGEDGESLEESDEVDEAEEEPEEIEAGEQIPITAVTPDEVTADLANRLAALDRSEMVASGRNLAIVNARALLTKLQTLSGSLWVAGPLNRPIGWATLTTPAEGGVLHGTVSTRNRRKGVADRLLEEVLAYAAEHTYASIISTVWTDSPAEAFVQAHGFEPGTQPAAVRRQDLYATAERRGRIEEDAASYGASYELATAEEELEQGGGSLYRVVARHLVTGVEVGFAELTVTEGAPEFAINGMLRVEPGHRGTRLGTLMSVELIGFVQSKAKKVRAVQVSSPASDPYITTILDRLGFRVAGLQLEHRLRLR